MSELEQLLTDLIKAIHAQTEAINALALSNEAMANIIADDMGDGGDSGESGYL